MVREGKLSALDNSNPVSEGEVARKSNPSLIFCERFF
jgi:hypothetical protein